MRVVFYIIWLLILAVFQPTLARGIAVCSIAPNLFLCFVVLSLLSSSVPFFLSFFYYIELCFS